MPPGVLLHYIAGKPVFMHNSTFPHNGMVTCAHCTGPRRMNASRYEPARLVTHYESEYGAAPNLPYEQTFDKPYGRVDVIELSSHDDLLTDMGVDRVQLVVEVLGRGHARLPRHD